MKTIDIYYINVDERKGTGYAIGHFISFNKALAALKEIVGTNNDEFGNNLEEGLYQTTENSYEIFKTTLDVIEEV